MCVRACQCAVGRPNVSRCCAFWLANELSLGLLCLVGSSWLWVLHLRRHPREGKREGNEQRASCKESGLQVYRRRRQSLRFQAHPTVFLKFHMCVLSLSWQKSHAYLSHDGHMIKQNAATQHVSRVALRTRAARVVHAGIDCLLVMPDHLNHNIRAPTHN